jgi:Flagellar hook-length control protein FliK
VTVVPTAAAVAVESAFVAAMPLPEPISGLKPAVGPLVGKMPAAAAKFALCLTTALAVPTLPVQTNPVVAPPVTQTQGVGQALQVKDAPPSIEFSQPVVAPVVLEPDQPLVAGVALNAARSTQPVQQRASSKPTPQAPQQNVQQLAATVLPTVQIPAAVIEISPAPPATPDHKGEVPPPPAQPELHAAAPLPVTPAAAEDKSPPAIPVATSNTPEPTPQPLPSAEEHATPPPAQPTPPQPAAKSQPAVTPPPASSPPIAASPPAAAIADVPTPLPLVPVATAPVTPTHAAPSPAAQITPALVSLSSRPDGTSTLTMRLEPSELGQVRIAIERPQDAPPRVDITVERSETLTLLLHDQPQLQRALDQAGVPSEGRSVAFHLAAPAPSARPETQIFATPSGAPAYAGDDRRGPPREPLQQPQRQAGEPEADQSDAVLPPPIWLRAGLDITA